jgi:FMN phosphatase YigB (HAD superfamily)
MLHRAGSDIQSTKVLGIFADIEADLQTCDEPMSYPELLRRAFSVLTHQLGIVNTAEEEQGFINSVTAWEAFPDSVQTIRRLGAYIPLIALANVDATMYDSVRSKIDMDNIFSGAITITSQFRPIPCSFQALISHCKEKFNARPEEILVVGSSVFHDLAPAWEMGIPVTWISRNSAVVGSRRVEYCYTKRPSAIFSNLSDFAQWFINRPSLCAGQPNLSDSRPLFSITNAYTPADDSQLPTDLRHKSNGV